MTRLSEFWNSYKYRFVPWLWINAKNRQMRIVTEKSSDKIVSDETVTHSLRVLFSTLYEGDIDTKKTLVTETTFTDNHDSRDDNIEMKLENAADPWEKQASSLVQKNLAITKKVCGFTIGKGISRIPGGGTGVFLTSNMARKGSIVAMYPGTVYQPTDPIFFQSLGNPYVFRCLDGIYIDGSNRFFSKYIFKSCSHRDQIGIEMISDISWLSDHPANPLAIGQFVNNQTSECAANVVYQEFDASDNIPQHLWQYIPNIHYSLPLEGNWSMPRKIRTVVLIALRDIKVGEELYANYFTVVQECHD